ncbi:retropepsin-like aspartic protease, partial [Phenylobacterium sp.]|uniref:retropepsin-like aspartic protease n=1 Tax=Phenylobacterium sp. TaxID=1871053 RepID=UPI002FDA1347
MIQPAPSRRATLAGLAATLASACARPLAEPLIEPPVMVNLAELGAGAGAGADLAAGADRARRMTAPVTLNGLGPYAFVVDTGANHSVLALDLADALSLPHGRPELVHGIAGAEPAETALIDRLNVGQITARRVRTPLLERARLGVDGLLGVDVLRNRAVTLD